MWRKRVLQTAVCVQVVSPGLLRRNLFWLCFLTLALPTKPAKCCSSYHFPPYSVLIAKAINSTSLDVKGVGRLARRCGSLFSKVSSQETGLFAPAAITLLIFDCSFGVSLGSRVRLHVATKSPKTFSFDGCVFCVEKVLIIFMKHNPFEIRFILIQNTTIKNGDRCVLTLLPASYFCLRNNH